MTPVGPDGPDDTGRAFRPPRSGARRARALPHRQQRSTPMPSRYRSRPARLEPAKVNHVAASYDSAYSYQESSVPKHSNVEYIKGEIAAWRIYGVHNDYLSRRAKKYSDWNYAVGDWPKKGDRTEITIGRVPGDLIEAEKTASATIHETWGDDRPWLWAEDPAAALDKAIRSRMETMSLEKFTEGFGLWVTLLVRRPMRLKANAGWIDEGSIYWWFDRGQARDLDEQFLKELTNHLDITAVLVAAGMGSTADGRSIRLRCQSSTRSSRPQQTRWRRRGILWSAMTVPSTRGSVCAWTRMAGWSMRRLCAWHVESWRELATQRPRSLVSSEDDRPSRRLVAQQSILMARRQCQLPCLFLVVLWRLWVAL